MNLRSIALILMSAGLVGACATPYSETPHVVNYPTSKQRKVQAAEHWRVIGQDIARDLTTHLSDQRPLFVVPPAEETAFNRALYNQLTTLFVQSGFPVRKDGIDALKVEIHTQIVQFAPDRQQGLRHAGIPTALAAGVWALRTTSITTSAEVVGMSAIAVGAAELLSWYESEYAKGKTPMAEILVTTSISNNHQYVARNTSIYYVADSDTNLYRKLPLATQTIKVTGGE